MKILRIMRLNKIMKLIDFLEEYIFKSDEDEEEDKVSDSSKREDKR